MSGESGGPIRNNENKDIIGEQILWNTPSVWLIDWLIDWLIVILRPARESFSHVETSPMQEEESKF